MKMTQHLANQKEFYKPVALWPNEAPTLPNDSLWSAVRPAALWCPECHRSGWTTAPHTAQPRTGQTYRASVPPPVSYCRVLYTIHQSALSDPWTQSHRHRSHCCCRCWSCRQSQVSVAGNAGWRSHGLCGKASWEDRHVWSKISDTVRCIGLRCIGTHSLPEINSRVSNVF